MKRWRDRSVTSRAMVIIAAEIVVIAGAAWAMRRSARVGYLFPKMPKFGFGDLPGFDSEETDEPEPDGIVYDNEPPCRAAPVSWGMQAGAEFCLPPADLEPVRKTEVEFATGGDRPVWPLVTDDDDKLRVSYEDARGMWHGKWGRHMGAKRTSTDPDTKQQYQRVHVGVDLFADPGDVVAAPEAGEVIAALPFYKGTGAIYVRTDSGIVVNLGEVKLGSWKAFGIPTGVGQGMRVLAGQPIARVGKSDDGSHMLHVETYDYDVTTDEIRQGRMRWIAGNDPPAKLLDPTRYLVRAQRVHYEAQEA